MKDKKVYKAAAYLRLSKGDGDVDGWEKAESNSISNQRLIIQKYIQEHQDLEWIDTYVDDGCTGTNFKRPELERMLGDIEEGRINCVIVKDLSRFGRERIQTGQFINRIFKEQGVRFIAIGDHYDSLTADGSETHLVMPMKALTNDAYSRDISVKVRSSQAIKRENGQYISAFAPYGYRKDPEDHNHLLIDEEAGAVVRKIFQNRIGGMTSNSIAGNLNELGIETPSVYKKRKGENYKGNAALSKGKWTAKQVIRVLKNEVYIGNLVQGKSSRVSYKVHKRIEHPEEDWIRVEHTHEALISEEDFRLVQSLLSRDSVKQEGASESYLFGGLLYCGICGKSLIRKIDHKKTGDVIYYDCSSYNRNGSCSRHHIAEEMLIRTVMESIHHTIARLCRYEELRETLEKTDMQLQDTMAQDREILRLKEELQKYRTLKSSLYQDLRDGLLSENQFTRYRDNYSRKEGELQSAIRKQKELIERIYKEGLSARKYIQQFRKNPHTLKLGRELLVTLIDRIIVEEDNSIEIHYRNADELTYCERAFSEA